MITIVTSKASEIFTILLLLFLFSTNRIPNKPTPSDTPAAAEIAPCTPDDVRAAIDSGRKELSASRANFEASVQKIKLVNPMGEIEER